MLVLRMALRELWRVKVRIGLLAIVLALQIMTIGGAYVMTHSFTESRDYYYRTLRFADLTVGFVPASDTEMPSLEVLRRLPGVAAVARRYVTRGTIEDEKGETPPWPVQVVYLDPGRQDVNDIAVHEGGGLDPANPDGVVIDASFSETRRLRVGDPIVVNPTRFATRFRVAGLGTSPEYLTPAVDPRFLLPAKGSMGVIYASRAKLDELFVDRLYDELLFRYEPGADEDATRKAILRALASLEIEEVVPRRQNVGYKLHEELLRVPRTLTPILALVVALLGAIVAYVLVMRIVESQRREIGALLAMGFPSSHFLGGYLLVALVPALAGVALGIPLARAFGSSNAIAQARSIGIPTPAIVMPVPELAGAATFAVMITLIGAAVPLMSILRMTPALAMSGGHEITFAGLPRPLEALLGRGRASTRYALRNVLRRARLSTAVVLLLGAGIAAPAALLSLNSSWDRWSAEMGAHIRWDASVNFRVPLGHDQLVSLVATPGLHATELFVQGRSTLARGDVDPQEVRVRGLVVPSQLDPRHLVRGRDVTSSDALEIVLNEGLARDVRDSRPIVLGETVRLTSPRGKSLDLVVVGVVHDASSSTVHVPMRTAQRLFELGDKVTGMYVVYGRPDERAAPPPLLPAPPPRPEGAEEIDLGTDSPPAAVVTAPAHADAETTLKREEMVLGMQSRAEAIRTTKTLVHEQRVATLPFLFVGTIFALAAVLGVLAVFLLEREAEYATLRALGHGRASIARIVATEIGALGAIGVAVGALAWVALDAWVVGAISRALFPLPTAYRASDFASVAVPTVLCLAVAVAATIRSITRADLRAVLAARNVG